MKSFYKKAILAVVILPLTFSTVYAKQNNHKGNRGGAPLKSMLALVDLTADQQKAIDVIIQDHRASKVKSDYREKMQSLIKADTFNTEQAKALIVSKEALKEANQIDRMKMTYDIYHVLTAEQQGKMDLLFEQYDQKTDRRGKGNKGNKSNKNNQWSLN
jgi:Spy/CpxP family protein refolding chaperone